MQDGEYVVPVQGGQTAGSPVLLTTYLQQNPQYAAHSDAFGGFGGFVWLGVAALLIVLAWALYGMPKWRVWAQKKRGEADLQQAHQEQQIQVSQAQGRVDAAQLNKQAAIVEAEAVSEQIKVIGANLLDHPLYLKWQWVEMMNNRDSGDTIYVPTEANLPILEAGKRAYV